MLQSELFSKTRREAPKDEESVNARLLTRGGFVYKNSAGVYSFLPLGWRVLKKIADIIREEMDAIGGQEMFMAALHDKRYLTATGRWNVGVVYKVLAGDEDQPSFNISWTHEEVIAEIAAKYVNSYHDLPFAVYQIQTKFRHEPRAKSGLLRGREFLMKDLYSFHASEDDLNGYYQKVAEAYHRIFKRCGLKAIYTLAAGGEFTASNTHEFQVPVEVGEDTIYVCEKCEYAENKEISKLKAGDECPTRLRQGFGGQKCGGAILEKRAVEVGNIFPLGTKYSEAFDLRFVDERDEKKYVVMGSYGIGLGRTMGTIVEVFHDAKGIIWPQSVAPFRAHLISLETGDSGQETRKFAEKVYNTLQKAGIEVLYDDREDVSAGKKFNDADLIGIPYRLVVSEKTKDQVEVKKRGADKTDIFNVLNLIKILKK